jgi:hypothetical protein
MRDTMACGTLRITAVKIQVIAAPSDLHRRTQ